MTKKNYSIFLLLLITGFATFAKDGNLDFIQNKNQFPEPVRYKAFLPGGAVFLRSDGFTFSYYKEQDLERIHELKHDNKDVSQEQVNFHAYSVTFSNANKNAVLTQEDKQSYYHNYFIGNDPNHWAGNVPLYKKVTWNNVYEGIDAVVYSKGQSMKYDFVVKPGADASQIVLAFEGVKPELMKDGSLRIHTSVNTITEQAPYVYQVIDGKEVAVKCRYAVKPGNKIAFELPDGYQKAYPLIIDPVLVFSTFSGSTASTFGFSATYDLSGNLYAGGECFGTGWPVTTGAFQLTYGTNVDAGINKYSSNGTSLIYSTYYGGNGSDLPNNMMVNANEELVMCGTTTSPNLPVSVGCYDNILGGSSDIYIARFSVSGATLKAATYLGGSNIDASNTSVLSPNYGDANRGEVLTATNGNIYVASSSNSADFPTTAGAIQTTIGGLQDGVVCKLDSNLTTLMYSTFLGGTDNDAAFSLVLNSTNEIVVCGGTSSANFPTTTGSLHTTAQGGTDGFVSIINTATGLTHSTYLGTALYDHAFKVQIDLTDNIFVMGQTASTSTYPVSPGVFSVASGNIFIHKLNPTLTTSLISTRMGNNFDGFVPTAFMHDVCGNTYLSGFGAASNSPLSPGAYQSTPGSFWLGALGPGFTSLLYGTFFGPSGTHVDGGTSRFDPQGIIYHSACTADPSFPTTPTAVHPIKLTGGFDIASYKFNMDVGVVLASFGLANNANDTGCSDYYLQFSNQCVGATDYFWDFGDGDTSTLATPSHTFAEGPHTITLIASKANGCNLADTASMNIYVKHTDKPLLTLQDTFLCDPMQINLHADVSNVNTLMGFHWEPVSAITSNPNQATVTVNPALSSVFTVYISNAATGECVDTAMGSVAISLFDYSHMTALPIDTTICPGDTILLRAYGGTKYLWSPDENITSTIAPFTEVWPAREMDYKVLIQNDSGCKIERAVVIHFFPPVVINAGDDQDIKLGESTQLEGKAMGAYLWVPAGSVTPANILNPIVTPTETTTYYFTVISKDGCTAYDSVTVHVTNAMLPNAFSPNDDGLNDIFKLLPKDERVRLKDFSVYNRYGQKVFFTRDITEGWDGYYNGTMADLDTYFYLVRYIIGANTYSLKGDVTLIR
jgi:gliding motility-associated-like protein